ncbi:MULTISPECIES: hypothetical protein [Enterobacter]|uniref:Flagellar hook-associated protein n=1 Tax=Enterobacter rongchengensis TaxID=3030999 RepID=A0ABV4J9W1_9ENTR|nr:MULTISPECIES: hypothetical protein [Enterobacter]HCR0840650.1 hypothetical protein [Enterobacter cancerogenus]EKX4010875.1 hypothetical protein [Enterobacter cloacae]KVK35445.1 hypothetical protein ABF69_0202430 [Enterobacter chengduensis]KZP92820.1 hypothetical protein A3463_18155 [Enterobacter chengduensis]MDL0067750.1 hypothetical protein [Enterobacter chengduensis]
MQVGLKTTSLATTPAPVRTTPGAATSVARPDALANVRPTGPQFPESALLSRRPLRYNVQLNQQLTSVQKAESYLSETETQLLMLRHQATRGGGAESAKAVNMLLRQRGTLSGGTVDRNFNVTLQQKSQVNFTLPGMEKILEPSSGETLVFALGGGRRELTAVAIPPQATPRQALMQLNVGLGKLGIHATLSGEGQVRFQVAEDRWARVSHNFSVRGEGQQFPADAFTLLAPAAEPSREDEVGLLASQWSPGASGKMQQTLEQITRERSKLHQHQERVSARIQDMSAAYTPDEALETARALGSALANGGTQYGLLAKALAAQGNVSLTTVKNLLGE